MVRQPSHAIFRHPKLEEFLTNQPPDSVLLKMILEMEDVLMENTYQGDRVKKSLTPKHYIEEYDLPPRSPILYVYDHPRYFRSCYTVARYEGLGMCPVILDIMDHDEYNRKFGFRKK